MVVSGDTTGRSYLVLNNMKKLFSIVISGVLMLSVVFANDPQEAPAKLKVDKHTLINFVKSLIIPGWGQWENGNKVRSILYVTVEVAGIYGYQSNYSAGHDKELEFKVYGDEHWSYDRWSPLNSGNLRTHQMPIYIDENNNERPIKDHHFYENISKYPEFVCGWDDWDAQGDLAEADLSPHKVTYVEMRTHSNELFRSAQLAGTLIMVNHLISAFDAALSTDLTSFETSSYSGKLYINPLNVARGISMEVTF